MSNTLTSALASGPPYSAMLVNDVNVTSPVPLENPDDGGGGHAMTIDQYLWMYVSPVIFVIGLSGNCLTIIVMQQKRMRGTSTCVYLTLMAAADIGVLVVGILPEWLEQCEFVVLKEIHPWICKIEKFVFYVFGDLAIWIIVAFTFDRFIAVCFPFRKRSVCVPRRAKIACLVLFLVAILKNIHVFWTRGTEYEEDGSMSHNCGRPEPYTYFEYYVRPWIAFAFVSALPFLVIGVCNVLIIKKLVSVQRMRAISCDNSRTFTQTTAMCLSASITFLVLITPSIVLLIGKPYWTSEDDPNPAYDIAKAINNQLVYVNHSINFFLYCLTGERFRGELVALFTCGDDGRGQSVMSSYGASTPRKYTTSENRRLTGNSPSHSSPERYQTTVSLAENGVVRETDIDFMLILSAILKNPGVVAPG